MGGCGCKKKKTERAVNETNIPKMSITIKEVNSAQQEQTSSKKVEEENQKIKEANN